jgi:HPt (histidine-containing phosphotransfer) domain-containing protein
MKLMMDDEEVVGALAVEFLRDTVRQINVVKELIVAGDWEGASRIVQNLASSADSVGARLLSMATTRLEKALGQPSIDTVEPLMKELEEQFNQVRDAMAG